MDTLVCIGTYSVRGSEGIYLFRMDAGTGRLTPVGSTPAGKNPSYLAVDRAGRFLYAVSEVEDSGGKAGGGVRAFALDRSRGTLRFLDAQSSRGSGPCHLTVDATARCVLVANYASGSVAVLPILDDGRLGEASDFVQHPAPAVSRERQEGPHAHSVTLDPSNGFAFVCDLGLDRIVVYALDAASGTLRPAPTPRVALHPGAGPRHFAFHPSGRFAYVIDELDNTVCAYRCPAPGELEYVQRLSTLPEGWGGKSWCADIHVSPDGRHVYGSNRGHHSIAVFAVHPERGTLSPAGHASTRGEWPRSFALDPSGRFAIVANERSDSVVGFTVDRATGGLEPTGQVVSVPAPVCVKILAP